MDIQHQVRTRAKGHCEFCNSSIADMVYEVRPSENRGADAQVLICRTCHDQLEGDVPMDPDHWHCLNDSMWSTVPGVQVMAWRILNQLREHIWPIGLLDMLFLDEVNLAWAQSVQPIADHATVPHLDCNGTVLEAGDTVTLIKDLKVKGANFMAKRGTPVRRISLVPDQPDQIEGKVNGQQIVILTQFVKKAKGKD